MGWITWGFNESQGPMGGQSTFMSHLPSGTSHNLIIPNDCLLPLSLMIHTVLTGYTRCTAPSSIWVTNAKVVSLHCFINVKDCAFTSFYVKVQIRSLFALRLDFSDILWMLWCWLVRLGVSAWTHKPRGRFESICAFKYINPTRIWLWQRISKWIVREKSWYLRVRYQVAVRCETMALYVTRLSRSTEWWMVERKRRKKERDVSLFCG